ncbi:GGDEF domain-containing protein [Peristeroidobacter soli]|uniref:GGDEF domain-containing protein n=1 Tax=Peristeroidobacter soli TaxID=2497877 RepID=UPI0013007A65|nr:GGDEF domain-containing protein [Peristeroidobacter soli]
MWKARRLKVIQYYGLLSLLGLMFLVQLWALAVVLLDETIHSQHVAIMIADVLVMLIGAALTSAVWHARPRIARRPPADRPVRPAAANVRSPAKQPGSVPLRKQPLPVRPAAAPAKPVPDAQSHGDSNNVTAMLHQLAHKAQHDSLTGLPNRSLALDRLQQLITRAERHQYSLAVMFIDLNGFKPLNDTYGHDFGDKVLRKTAERLKRSIRGLDTVARLGGDEFLIIMDQVDEHKALEAAQTLSTIVGQPVAAKRGPVCVGMSTGIAIYPKHGTAARPLLRAADSAMYQSKRQGGHPVLAAALAEPACPMSRTGRFNDTTSINPKLLDTWDGTLRGLRALSETPATTRPKRTGE